MMKLKLLFVLLIAYCNLFSQGCPSINNNNAGNGGTHAMICFFNSSGQSMGPCLDCQLTGNGWKCNSAFNAYANYYSATINGVPCVNAVSLPVELTEFYGKQNNHFVDLHWETASESMSDHYEICRLNEFGEFEVIRRIPAAGNSSTLLKYDMTDEQPKNGTNYYVLKQFDLDGKSFVYDPVSVEFVAASGIIFYPNPLTSSIIRWNKAEYVKSIQIYSTDGRMIDETVGEAGVYTFENSKEAFYLFKVIYQDLTESYFKVQR